VAGREGARCLVLKPPLRQLRLDRHHRELRPLLRLPRLELRLLRRTPRLGSERRVRLSLLLRLRLLEQPQPRALLDGVVVHRLIVAGRLWGVHLSRWHAAPARRRACSLAPAWKPRKTTFVMSYPMWCARTQSCANVSSSLSLCVSLRKVSYETPAQKAMTSALAALMKSPIGSLVASSIFSTSLSSKKSISLTVMRVSSLVRTSLTLW